MTKESWLDQIENSIDEEKKVAAPPLRPVKSEDKLVLPLFLLILIMCVGLVGAYTWKKKSSTPTYVSHHQSNVITQSPNNRPRYDYGNYQKDVDEVRKETEKVWDRTKWNTDKMRLMTCVNNHNTCVVKNNYPKSDLIYINSDWTIDRLPNHLRLSDEDRAWLINNHIRQQASIEEDATKGSPLPSSK